MAGSWGATIGAAPCIDHKASAFDINPELGLSPALPCDAVLQNSPALCLRMYMPPR